MKIISFIIVILGIIILLFLYIFPFQVQKITSYNQIKNLTNNERISITGKVTKEYMTNNQRTLLLDNNIKLYCLCDSYLNKKIVVDAKINSFNNQNTIKVLSIKEVK